MLARTFRIFVPSLKKIFSICTIKHTEINLLGDLSSFLIYLQDDLEEAASYNSDIPEDAVGPGVCYTPVTLPNPKNRSEHFEIYVSNIVSPGLFWIQLRGSTTTGALESLMNGLE